MARRGACHDRTDEPRSHPPAAAMRTRINPSKHAEDRLIRSPLGKFILANLPSQHTDPARNTMTGSINRDFFFEHARMALFGASLKPKQVEGLTALLNYWENKHAPKDDRMLAYLMATAFHETDKTMQPIREYGSMTYFDSRYGPPPVGKNAALARTLGNTQPGDGSRFCGRGYVQLTGRRNYTDWGNRLELPLSQNPDLALQAGTAMQILVEGALLGTFTGKKLADYFNQNSADWRNARRVINRLDKADLIAGHARNFYASISYTI